MQNLKSHKDQFTDLMARSGTSPEIPILLHNAADYKKLLEQITTHKYHINKEFKHELGMEESFRSWVRNVYNPLSQALEAAQLDTVFPDKTTAELFLLAVDHQYYLSLETGKPVSAAATVASFSSRYSSTLGSKHLYRMSFVA